MEQPGAAAGTVAAEGAAAPVEQQTTETTQTEAPVKNDRGSARQRVHELGERREAAQRAAREARERAQQQPRAQDGTFSAEQTAEAARAAAVADSEAGSATGTETASEAADVPPQGMVRIELPEGHPLRDQGETYLDVPAAKERTYRTLVNSAARRAEAEQAQTQLAEERTARARVEAELRFVRERGDEFWTREDQALYDDIIASYTEGLGADAAKARAEAFKRGRQQEAQQAIAQVQDEADLAAVAAHWRNEGQVFQRAAHERLPQMFEGLTSTEVSEAIDMYARRLASIEEAAWAKNQHLMTRAEFDRRFADTVRYSDKDFFAVARDYIETRPGVLSAKRARAESADIQRRSIQADTEAAERGRLKDAGRRHAQNPQRALGGVSTSSASADTGDEQPDLTKMSPDQVRRYHREQAAKMGSAMGSAR